MEIPDLLWRMYEDNREYARHHENQRSTASNLTMVVSAGILGLLTLDQKLNISDLPLTAFLFLIGLFGAVFSAKHYERVRLHLYRANQYLSRLETLVPGSDIDALKVAGSRETKNRFPVLYHVQLNKFWIGLHLFLSFVGLVMTIIILGAWLSPS